MRAALLVALLAAAGCGDSGGSSTSGGDSPGGSDGTIATSDADTANPDAGAANPDAAPTPGDDAGPAGAPDAAADDSGGVGPDGTVADTSSPADVAGPVDPPPLEGPVLLDISTGGITIQPALALGLAGDTALAFSWPDPDSSLGIGLLLLDAEGEVLAGPVAANTKAEGGQNEPSVCALASGGYVVTWSSDVASAPDPDGASLQIAFRRFDATGAPVTADEERVLTEVPGNHWLARLACDPAGGFVVVGVRPDPDGTFGTFAWRFADDGSADGDPLTLHTADHGGQVFPFVGVGAGQVVAAWEDDGHDPDGAFRVVTRRWSDEGVADPLVAHGSMAAPAKITAVAVDPWSGAALVGGVVHLTGPNTQTLVKARLWRGPTVQTSAEAWLHRLRRVRALVGRGGCRCEVLPIGRRRVEGLGLPFTIGWLRITR